jgi:hypothetical protein
MPETWKERYDRAQHYIPYIKKLLGLICVEIADIDEDRKHNTDLLFDVGSGRVAVRVRRIEERLKYNRRNEVTFRFSLSSGVETEFSKLLYGWGDYFLYGWGEDTRKTLPSYVLIDLEKFRGWWANRATHYMFASDGQSRLPQGVSKFFNEETGEHFLAFCLDCMPRDVAKHRYTLLQDDPPNTNSHWLQYHDPLKGQTHGDARLVSRTRDPYA